MCAALLYLEATRTPTLQKVTNNVNAISSHALLMKGIKHLSQKRFQNSFKSHGVDLYYYLLPLNDHKFSLPLCSVLTRYIVQFVLNLRV